MYYNTYGYNKYFREDKECFDITYGNFKNVSIWICGNDVLRNIRFDPNQIHFFFFEEVNF